MFALACVAFFTTCGGPFGIEPLVAAVGPGLAVVLILATPLVWTVPMALMVAELATLMPEEGGYYVWVRETLGPFWAVQEAWWTMGYSTALLAIFPVLFMSYLSFFVPSLNPATATHPGLAALLRWLGAVLVAITATLVNLQGAREVGRSAKISAVFVVGAFALLALLWLKRGPALGRVAHLITGDLTSNHGTALLLGLSIIVYNYSGWDNVSTFAAEVDRPRRNYPRAIALAVVVVILIYVVPVIAGLSVNTDPQTWSTDAGWPVLAHMIGGRWLGILITAAALLSSWALFNAQLLYVSRLPYVMARDGWLADVLARVSPNTGVPKTAIVGFCLLTALFATLSFGGLAVIQCVLYTGALTLELLALIILRRRRPDAARPFRIPGGWWGLAYVCVPPLGFAVLVVLATLRDWRSFPGQLLVIAAIVLSGIILYFSRRKSFVPVHDQAQDDGDALVRSQSEVGPEVGVRLRN